MATTALDFSEQCPNCRAHQTGTSNFCNNCGTSLTLTHSQSQILPASVLREEPHPNVHGFSQAFGLHPIAGLTTLAVNTMLFTGELATMGALIPVAFAVAVVLSYITYKCQMRYGDDHDAALVKAMAVGLLTAIPTGLPAFLTLPSTAVGVIHMLRRKG